MTKPPFEFGQQVWIATASAYARKEIKCPVCDGKCNVVLILGSGERVPVLCEFCQHGSDEPSGVACAHSPASSIRPATVTGLYRNGDKWEVQCGSPSAEREVFATEAEAEARRIVLHAEAEEEAKRNFEGQFKNARGKYSWTVGYHRGCIKRLRRQLEWHESRLRKPSAVE